MPNLLSAVLAQQIRKYSLWPEVANPPDCYLISKAGFVLINVLFESCTAWAR